MIERGRARLAGDVARERLDAASVKEAEHLWRAIAIRDLQSKIFKVAVHPARPCPIPVDLFAEKRAVVEVDAPTVAAGYNVDTARVDRLAYERFSAETCSSMDARSSSSVKKRMVGVRLRVQLGDFSDGRGELGLRSHRHCATLGGAR